ncbi:clumping factor B-like [Panonychus citri]|uniref:clumping factor B-like n=1 Tax=Panonychus citri TaxID=50023 RepID=UPI0023079EA3|nr:clumping factor B-like [Panonychus citri]
MMESLVTRVNLLLGLISIVSAGGLHLDFGVNLPPFVLHMPRFNLPPIKIAATFKPSTGSSPFAIKFPGISIATNQGNQQDSWWNQNQAWPEPEPEVEPYPESEPEPEPEPESEPEPEPEYHHNSHHSYDPWGKSSVKSIQHKDSWASRGRLIEGNGNNQKHLPQHIYMKQQSTKSSVLTNAQQFARQKSIVNNHMSALRGSSSSQSSSSSSLPSSPLIDKSPPTPAEVDSWLNQMKSINTLDNQYQLSNPMDYDRRRSSNSHITKPYTPPINPKSGKIDRSQSHPTATIKISNQNNLLSNQPVNQINQQQQK